jgi:PAS domain S-box-containing protein
VKIREPTREPPRGRSAGQGDLLVIAMVAAAVLLLGMATGTFARFDRMLNESNPGAAGSLLGFLLILGVAAGVYAYSRAMQARRESSMRAASDARFRTMVEQLPAITYVWDPSPSPGAASTRYISPQVERVFGVTPEAWVTEPELWKRLLHPDDRDRVLAASASADRDGTGLHEEYRAVRPDGGVVWVRDDSVPVARDATGRPTLMQGVMFDVTEQKEAEARLLEAEARFRTIVERVPTVAYIWDAAEAPGAAPALYISPQIEHLLGYQAQDWIDDPTLWTRRIDPGDRDVVLAAWEAAVDAEVPFSAEYRFRTADERWVWVRDEAVPVGPGARGRPIYQGVMIDVTEPREAQDRLREAEERFRTLVEQLPLITYTEDPETGEILYVSPQLEQVYGYTPEAWKRDPHLWEQRLHPDDRERVIAANEADTGDTWGIDYRSIARDGHVIWVHNEAMLIRDEHGAPRFWQGVVADITERKEAEERIRAAEERYRTLVEQVPVVVYVDAVDEVSTARYVSPRYERLTGYTAEQRVADPSLWVRMLHPDDRERTLAESARTNATGDPFDVEYRIVRADGRVAWVHDQAYLVEEPGGGHAWQGVMIDVTERRLAEEALGRRDRILEAAGFAAERFLAATGWTEGIAEVLERLGRGADASRAFVFRTVDGGTTSVVLDHAWTSPTIAGTPGSSQEFPYASERFARWEAVLAEGGVIHGPVNAYPDEEREALERQGIRACIAVPVFVDGDWWGYVGFDHVEHRDWQAAEIGAVRVAANTLGAAIGRERDAARLLEAEERYRTLIETIPAATYIDTVDALSQAIYMSPQVETIYGYTPQEWRDQPELWERGLHPEDHDRVVASVQRHNLEGTPYQAEYRFRHRDGRWVWVHDEAVMLADEEGRPRFSQGVVYDITESKQQEERLREAEERFRAIVEHVPSAIYVDRADTSMESIYIGPQIEEIAGVSPQEWLDDPELWLGLADPEDREPLKTSYLAAAASGAPWHAEYRLHTRDGRTIWVRDETTFLHDEEGNPIFIQGVISDITERKLAEQALRDSEQREREAAERLRALDEMKNTFLAAVSHELRSPLTSILGLSLTLERTPTMEADDRQDLLARLSVNARKLDRLLKDLLDIDRLNRGIVEPQYRAVDLAELVAAIPESLDPLSDRSVVVEAGSLPIRADPAKVERIVENLLMNAARHTASDRTIWLRVARTDGGALLVVEDDGPGVPEELRADIFEPFRQGPSASPHAPGTGIGLSLVARFAQLHGGRAWVEERPGGGASFRVFLPDHREPGPGEPVARFDATV